MNNRNFQYNEWAGPSTSTAPILTATLTPTWAVGDRYLIIANVIAHEATSSMAVQFVNDGTGTTYAYDYAITPRDLTNDYYACPMFAPYEVSSSTELLELYVDSDTTAPDPGATARQAGIYVFRLLDNDQINADYLSAGGATSGTGSFETVTGSTVTIAKTGEYFVMASASVGKSETTANFDVRLAHTVAGPSTTGYGQQTMRANSGTKNFPWAHMRKLSLTAGDTLTIEHRATTAGVTSTNYASIVALYLDDFPNWSVIEDTANATRATGLGAYGDHTNMHNVYALQPYDALLLSCCQYRNGAAAEDTSLRTQYDGVDVAESRNESVVANIEHVHFAAKALDPATGGQHKFVQQLYNHDAAGITTAVIEDACTAMLQMNNNATMRIRGSATMYGATQMGL